MIRSSLATKLLLLSLLPALSVVVAGAGIQRSFRASASAEAQVVTSISALELANDVAALADKAILEERGFLVTGGDGFAEPYYNAIALFAARVAELERLFADAPERQAEVRELRAVFRRWQDEVATPAIAARRRNEIGAGAALVANTGRLLSNQIGELATRITRAQSEALGRHLLESGRVRAAATRWTLGVVLVTVGFAVSIGVALAMQLRRRLSDLEGAAEALARGDFGRRAPAGGNDEISRLARSFNSMADEVRDRSLEAAGLRKLSELLQACSNVQEAFDVIERVLPTLLPSACGVIHITNASRNLLESPRVLVPRRAARARLLPTWRRRMTAGRSAGRAHIECARATARRLVSTPAPKRATTCASPCSLTAITSECSRCHRRPTSGARRAPSA